MSTIKLTDKYISAIKAPAEGRVEVWDSVIVGLGLRVSRTKKTFQVMYRVHGRKRRMTLGRYPTWKLADARERAREVVKAAEKGEDPAAERKEARQRVPSTVGDIVADFIERYAKPRKKTWKADQRRFDVEILPYWRDRPIEDIAKRDVLRIVDGMVNRGSPVEANRLFEVLNKFFAWCVEVGYLDASPMAGLRKPTKEQSRDRVLSDDELRPVWEAADADGHPFGTFVKLSILLAQRRGELVNATWSEIDLDRGIWTIPATHTKAGRSHVVPLPSTTVAILRDMPVIDGSAMLFPARGRTDVPMSGWSRGVGRLRSRSGVDDFTLHDLRRTAASGMASLGFGPHVLAAVLNHAPGSTQGVTAIYNRHRYHDEKRSALEAWDSYMMALVNGANTGNVVTLRG